MKKTRSDSDFPRIGLADIGATGQGLHRPECVLATSAGDLFVSDKRGGINWLQPGGGQRLIGSAEIIPNGFAMLRDGSFVVANLSDAGGVWKMERNGSARPLYTEIEGITLGSVNFVWLDHLERLWICVSTVRPGDHQFRRDIADGFMALADGRGVRIVARDIHWTNECRIDPSGRYMYVNETFGRRVKRFRIGEDGVLQAPDTLTEFGEGTYPDGLTLDAEGALWVISVVSNRVIRVTPDGRQTVVIEDADPEHIARLEVEYLANRLSRPMLYDNHSQKLKNITSLAFGGPDLRTAYLGCLAGDSLATFKSPVAGLPPVHWNW